MIRNFIGNHFNVVTTLFGVVSGVLFAIVWFNYEKTVIEIQNNHNHLYGQLKSTNYKEWLKQVKFQRIPLSEEMKSFVLNLNSSKNVLESEFLYKKVPILCIVLCKKLKYARAAKNTWTKNCNHVMFFGSISDQRLPVIKFPHSTTHTLFCRSFIKAWKKYSNKFKWVLIVSDETYAIVENLRYYVAPLNSSGLFYLGRPMRSHIYRGIFNAADSGIVLSHGAAKYIKSIFSNETVCDNPMIENVGRMSRSFDISLAIILNKKGCNPVDTRDGLNRGRFNPFSPEKHMTPGHISIFNSYWRSNVFMTGEGQNCCSDHAITFNKLSPSTMYLYEYLLYHMAVFKNSPNGLGNKPPPYSSYKVRSDIDKMMEVGKSEIHYLGKKKTKSYDKNKNKSNAISHYLQNLFVIPSNEY